jgi:hypothetical protein
VCPVDGESFANELFVSIPFRGHARHASKGLGLRADKVGDDRGDRVRTLDGHPIEGIGVEPFRVIAELTMDLME